MGRSNFPRARPTKGQRKPPQPKRWRTHICVNTGQRDWDDEVICAECGFRRDHKVHELNDLVVLEAAELEARKMGEANE